MALVTGTAGNDSLLGTAGDDTLDGLAGRDTLLGGLGNDTDLVDLIRPASTDTLDGDVGNDAFIWVDIVLPPFAAAISTFAPSTSFGEQDRADGRAH